MEVNGSGLVIVVDRHEITFTDLPEIKNGDPMTVEGLKVHVLGNGKRFHITKRKIENAQNN